MGLQRFSEKKIKQIARLSGLDLDMVWNTSGGGPKVYARSITDGKCTHYLVNRYTGEWELDLSGHMTSCPENGRE